MLVSKVLNNIRSSDTMEVTLDETITTSSEKIITGTCKMIASDLDLDDHIETTANKQAFVTLNPISQTNLYKPHQIKSNQ